MASTIAFFADGALKKISASGGGVQTLCPAPDGRGGTWNRNGDILFAPTSTSASVARLRGGRRGDGR